MLKSRAVSALGAGMFLVLGNATDAIAQDAIPDIPMHNIVTSVIGGNALANVQGRAAVNIVAGDSNVQANSAALAIGLGEASAYALAMIRQSTEPHQAKAPGVAFAIIGDRAFSNAAGMISINQSSGVGNAQANAAAIGLGFEAGVVAESRLSATTSGGPSLASGPDSARYRGASIAESAFEGVRGLIQINQSAGSGNSTANTFALKVPLGAKP